MQSDDLSRTMAALLATKEGRQLIALLQSDGGGALRSAAQSLRQGNESAAQEKMAPLLQNSEVQALLSKLNQSFGHG